MAYRSSRRRPASRSGPRANKYDAGCSQCGRLVPAGAGILTGNRETGYEIRHGDRHWTGPPCGGDMIGQPGMGRWAGGCEDYADQPVYAPRQAPDGADLREVSRRAGGKYAYTSSGARMTMSSRRCEDAPCCGCCD
jgi:hypothetical protein